ncbi:MAG: HPF/RaiA family ribosome-associated protein [Acidobacteriota bacterium]
MQIHITGREVKPSNRLREHIQRRLNFPLQRFAPHIRKLHVQVRDLNGPRGGVDKSCQVKVFLMSGSTRVLEERAPSAYLAINSVVDKAATSIARRLQKNHDHRRAHPPSRYGSEGTGISLAAPGRS